MNSVCPHCGAPLHKDAAFCPHCARSINQRHTLHPPKPFWRKVLRRILPLCLIFILLLVGFVATRPQVYDSGDTGQVLYEDADGSYQLVLNQSIDRYLLMPGKVQAAVQDEEYRTAFCFYVNSLEDGTDWSEKFLPKVDNVAVGVVQADDVSAPMVCTEPAPSDFAPDAALVNYLDFVGQNQEAEILWTIHMKNGDTILLRHQENVVVIDTYDYYPEDASMNTLEDLQALIDKISMDSTLHEKDIINLHLPAVTYDGGLVIDKRPINLYGSTDAVGDRTTFTSTVRIAAPKDWMQYINGIDFVSNGSEVGVSAASARLHLIDCKFTGWNTAVLAYGSAWVNVAESTFRNNDVGFHFNSSNGNISHTLYNDNTFRNNGTAVLLEQLPTKIELDFSGCHFSGNDTDIDNRCDQKLNTSKAVFE